MVVRSALGAQRRRLRRDRPISVGQQTLTPVVIEEIEAGTTGRGLWSVVTKRPVAIIVSGPDGRCLLRLDEIAPPG